MRMSAARTPATCSSRRAVRSIISAEASTRRSSCARRSAAPPAQTRPRAVCTISAAPTARVMRISPLRVSRIARPSPFAGAEPEKGALFVLVEKIRTRNAGPERVALGRERLDAPGVHLDARVEGGAQPVRQRRRRLLRQRQHGLFPESEIGLAIV